MGGSAWFVNHVFEKPDSVLETGRWNLEIRPSRAGDYHRFLEPVIVELKLTNTLGHSVDVNAGLLEGGGQARTFVGRVGGDTQQWRPFVRRLEEPETKKLRHKESVYGSVGVSASTKGWLIDEPSHYKVQAAIDIGGEIVVSNVLRIHIAPPVSAQEAAMAGDYFTEDVARVLAFGGRTGTIRSK